MRWNLRMKAAEAGIWKSTELRRLPGRGRARDQRREDVGLVDRHPEHDPPRRARRDLRRARLRPLRVVDPRARQGRQHRPKPPSAKAAASEGDATLRQGSFRAAGVSWRRCRRLRDARVAWTKARFCYGCLPGGRSPRRRVAVRLGALLQQRVCVACHPRGPEHIDSARMPRMGCDPHIGSRCWTCRAGGDSPRRRRLPCCGRRTAVSRTAPVGCAGSSDPDAGHPARRAVDLVDAIRFGQQLFFANMFNFSGGVRRPLDRPAPSMPPDVIVPVPHRQFVLVPMATGPAHPARLGFPPPPDPGCWPRSSSPASMSTAPATAGPSGTPSRSAGAFASCSPSRTPPACWSWASDVALLAQLGMSVPAVTAVLPAPACSRTTGCRPSSLVRPQVAGLPDEVPASSPSGSTSCSTAARSHPDESPWSHRLPGQLRPPLPALRLGDTHPPSGRCPATRSRRCSLRAVPARRSRSSRSAPSSGCSRAASSSSSIRPPGCRPGPRTCPYPARRHCPAAGRWWPDPARAAVAALLASMPSGSMTSAGSASPTCPMGAST